MTFLEEDRPLWENKGPKRLRSYGKALEIALGKGFPSLTAALKHFYLTKEYSVQHTSMIFGMTQGWGNGIFEDAGIKRRKRGLMWRKYHSFIRKGGV